MKFDLSAFLSDALENENAFLHWYSDTGGQHDTYLSYEKKKLDKWEKFKTVF